MTDTTGPQPSTEAVEAAAVAWAALFEADEPCPHFGFDPPVRRHECAHCQSAAALTAALPLLMAELRAELASTKSWLEAARAAAKDLGEGLHAVSLDLAAARQQLNAVRELHTNIPVGALSFPMPKCVTCGMAYPCPTALAVAPTGDAPTPDVVPLAVGDVLFGRPCTVAIGELDHGAAVGWCSHCHREHVINEVMFNEGRGPWRRVQGDAPTTKDGEE